MKSFGNNILKYFFSGLLLLFPIAICIYVVVQVFLFLDNLIPKLKFLEPINFTGLGVILLFLILTIIGFTFSKVVHFPLEDYFESLVKRIPGVNMVYSSSKDLMKAFVGEEKRFNKPVLVQISENEKVYKLGFVTDDTLLEINNLENYSAVYCPHSFNFSGELFIYPNHRLSKLETDSSNLMKYIVSGGVTELSKKS